jgi:hypothetical protein
MGVEQPSWEGQLETDKSSLGYEANLAPSPTTSRMLLESQGGTQSETIKALWSSQIRVTTSRQSKRSVLSKGLLLVDGEKVTS